MNDPFQTIFKKLPALRNNLTTEFDQLFGPQIKHSYFCKSAGVPYDLQYHADAYELVNAAWMADAALLAYVPNFLDNTKNFDLDSLGHLGWDKFFVKKTLATAGFPTVKFFNRQGTQLFVAHNSKAVVVSFRGTEVKDLRDLLYDATFVDSKEGAGTVHGGFQKALDAAWKSQKGEGGLFVYLKKVTKNGAIPAWFTGHSLGAALAIIAAKRWNAIHPVRGLYTFGSPGVGNSAFTQLFKGMNAIRFVHNKDIVTTVSQDPNLLHVGKLYFINENQKIQEKKKGRQIDGQKFLPKLQKNLLGDSLKFVNLSFKGGNTPQLPRWLTDHAPKFYSNYIRLHV